MILPLSTAFKVSHRFWIVVFSFSFVSVNILINVFDFFCDLLVIQKCVVQPPYVGIFNNFSPSLRSNLTALWSEKMLGMISLFLNLSRLDLWPRM